MLSKLPLILAKLLKEVNEILKYFKKNNNKKDQKNHMLKLQHLLTLLGKF